MRKAIFNGFHMLVIAIAAACVTAMIMSRQEPAQGKYVILDKEAAVASAVFSKPEFNEADRKNIITTLTAFQKRYTDQGYLVLTRESGQLASSAIVLAAVPGALMDVTPELADALRQALGDKP
jgi:hypothetical protein